MDRQTDRTAAVDLTEFTRLLAGSSLATDGAAAVRENADPSDIRRVLEYADELRDEERHTWRAVARALPSAGDQVLIAASGGLRPSRNVLVDGGHRPVTSPAVTYRQVCRLFDGNHLSGYAERRVRALMSLCLYESEMCDPTDGLDRLRMAERLVAEIADHRQQLELTCAVAAQRGMLLIRAGRFDESITLLDEAVELGEFAFRQGEPKHLQLSTHLFHRARAHNASGRPGQARSDLLHCLALLDEARVERSAKDAQLTELTAKALHSLGAIARQAGDVPGALAYFDRASRDCRQLPKGARFAIELDQAETLLAAGLLDEASAYLDNALTDIGGSGDNRFVAGAQALRAAIALAVGDWSSARRFASYARRRFERARNAGRAAMVALVGLRAEVGAALDRGWASPSLVERAHQLADRLVGVRLPEEEAVARLLIVRLELLRGCVAAAVAQLGNVPSVRQLASVESRMLFRLCRAEIAARSHDRRTAFTQARLGLDELARQPDAGTVEPTGGGRADAAELGRIGLRMAVSVDSPTRAGRWLFDWSERIRTAARWSESLPPVDDPALAERIQEYRRIGQTIREALSANQPTRELTARRKALHREISHHDRCGQRKTARLDEIVDHLRDRALISYVTVDDEILAVAVTDRQVRMVRLGPVRAAFDAARELRVDLDALSPDHLAPPLAEAVTRSARVRAQRLDDQLVRPMDDVVAGREIVVVPTGPLFGIAWGALPSLRGRPVTVVPSATSWLAAVRTPGKGAHARTVLVRGPGPWPAAVGEIGRLWRHHPDAWIVDGDQATSGTVLAALNGAGLAHIVAHGAHEPQNALFSHLSLTDRAMFAYEVAKLPDPPEHLVLAACELAFGQVRLDCDALGFAGVLLAAGSRTVVAAVSRVGDEAAAAAMAEYHRHLAAGESPAHSLAAATAVDPFRRPFLCLGASEPTMRRNRSFS